MKTENNEYAKMLPKRHTFAYSTVQRNKKEKIKEKSP